MTGYLKLNEFKHYSFSAFLVFTLVLMLTSCNKNKDNQIYKVGSTFVFNAKLLTNDTVEKEFTFEMIVSDDFYPDFDQTKINWVKYKKGDLTPLSDSWTGVEDSPEKIFLHPPRTDEFEILKFVSFPSVQLKSILNNTKYSSTGEINMSKQYNGIRVTVVKTENKYTGSKKIETSELSQDSLVVHEIIASSTSEAGSIKSKYLFNLKYGFVWLSYELPNDKSIIFELISTKI